jgi:hypothetical protein
MAKTRSHTPGPGLKILSKAKWYGPGYCGVCGTRGDELIPQSVRYWDSDDGWRMGVLCSYCGEECAARGPRPDDYAVATRQPNNAQRIDVSVSLGDLDGAYSDTSQEG